MKKTLYFALCLFILLVLLSFTVKLETGELNVLVLYTNDSNTYLDTYEHFNQSLIANLNVCHEDISQLKKLDPSKYQMVYLDQSLAGSQILHNSIPKIELYVKEGGSLFVENEFYKDLPMELLGAKEFREIPSFPKSLEYPDVNSDLKSIQALVKDFQKSYSKFSDIDQFENKSFGYGMTPSTASTLASFQGTSLYTLNNVGKGTVFFANSMLPNMRYVNSFDMQPKSDDQKYFNSTSASANYLIKNEFAAFVSKQKYGYVVRKVLGTYGRPAMAWQNHFEVTSAIKNESMQKWIDFLRPYKQIPSYTLARSTYEWGVWKESIAYHINVGDRKTPKFVGEEEGFHYSSGKHAMVEKEYLVQQSYPEYKSLAWPVDLPHRAFPAIADLDGDGIKDLVAGSADGNIYFYKGKGLKEAWAFAPGSKLTYTNGSSMNFGSFSAPVLYDLNRDGILDLIVGNQEGYIYSCINTGNNIFNKPSLLVQKSDTYKTVAPEIGDIDGDKIDDLIVGNHEGEIYIYKGYVENAVHKFQNPVNLVDEKGYPVNAGLYPAPKLFDFDGDGIQDIIVGNNQGYIKKFINKYPFFDDSGYVEGETLNQFGTNALWGGHNIVPFVSDINQDGLLDLVVGQLEFGMATPIDTPSFPYENELRKAIDYANRNFIDIHPHVYFHSYKNPAQEKLELELHKKAFSFYNLPWDAVGTNQHTWRVNNLNPTQTFLSEFQQGILWNSGFRPANNPVEPSLGWEYVWNMPFLLTSGDNTGGMLLFNAAPNIPSYEEVYPSISRLDMPVSYFYHIEYPIQTVAGKEDLAYKAQFLDNFRSDNDYNFMTEAQMAKSFLANMKSHYKIYYNPMKSLFYSLQNRLRTKQHHELVIKITEQNIPDIASEYQNTIGIKFEPGEKYGSLKFATNTDIFLRKNSDLYMAAKKNVKIGVTYSADKPHIARANVPVSISSTNNGLLIDVQGKGLQQIKLYAPDGIDIKNTDWEVNRKDNYYILTRYGDVTKLYLNYK